MTERRKSFRLYEVVLSVITIVFVAEAAAPAAAIGNSQYFWWVFLILAFLLPYGLIAAELGSAYQDEGGLYDWIKRAFGPKWGPGRPGIIGSITRCGCPPWRLFSRKL